MSIIRQLANLNEYLWMNGLMAVTFFVIWIFIPERIFLGIIIFNLIYFSFGNIAILYNKMWEVSRNKAK